MDELLALLADHINFMSSIRLCLDTAKKIQNAGKLSEEHRVTINILKNKVQSWITLNEQLSEMAIQAQAFIRETRQSLEAEIEELRSQGSNNLLQIEQLKAELEQKIKPIEEQLQVLRQFEQNLKAGQDAAKWLDKNQAALAKRAGNVVLDEYKELKTAFSPDQIDDFYWEIEKYLERISWCLTWGKYDLIEEPDLQTLPVYAYQMSFSYIRDQRIPSSMSSQAATELSSRTKENGTV
jgi:TolA-binding protein